MPVVVMPDVVMPVVVMPVVVMPDVVMPVVVIVVMPDIVTPRDVCRVTPQNIHQAGFVATRKQLQHALARECLPDRYSYHWSYHEIEAADSQLYFDCGFMKVVPLEPTFTAAGISDGGVSLQAFLLHHAPNKYVQEGVHVVDKFYLTAALLERWLSMCDRDM